MLRKLEAVEKSLQSNAKIVVPANTELVNMIGEMAGFLPLKKEVKEIKMNKLILVFLLFSWRRMVLRSTCQRNCSCNYRRAPAGDHFLS